MNDAPARATMDTVLALFRYLWALPNTLIGLLLLPFVVITNGRWQIVDGVLELHGTLVAFILAHLVPIPGGAAAMTLGHVVLGRDAKALDLCRTHERVHVRQCERWGPAFIPAYFLAAAYGMLTGRGGYTGNFFERQALESSADE
jgi:hypothetical protein